MKKWDLLRIWGRSMTIQASFSPWRMQSLGFAFTMLPMIRREGEQKKISDSLTRHLQMFNTHPYFTGPVIGSVIKIEESGETGAADHLKRSVMGPYAAIGDPFFWGVLRLFAAIAAIFLAIKGMILAPLMCLLLFNPAHLWVRGKGFIEGYRRGKDGINFIRDLDLPRIGGRLRLLSLLLIGILAAMIADTHDHPWAYLPGILPEVVVFFIILLCWLGLHRRISAVKILYGMMVLCMVLSI